MTVRLSPPAKILLDFAPLLLFFLAFKWGGVKPATIALIISTLLSIAIIYAYERKLALAPLISGALVTVMGGLSIALKNEQFIKMKPTFVNFAFAAILLTGVYAYKRGMLKYVLDVAFQLSEKGWLILSRRWGFFFLFLGCLNEVVWRNSTTEFWVDFKVFGMFSLTILFALSQFRLIEKYKLDAMD